MNELKKAYDIEYDDSLTDDASVAEKSGIKIHLIDGHSHNIKITSVNDLALAETLLKHID